MLHDLSAAARNAAEVQQTLGIVRARSEESKEESEDKYENFLAIFNILLSFSRKQKKFRHNMKKRIDFLHFSPLASEIRRLLICPKNAPSIIRQNRP